MYMKKIYLFLSFFTLSLSLNAQFIMKGELKNYDNKPVVLRVYENGIMRFLQRVKTDSKGAFTYKFPMAYDGVIQMELQRGAYQILSDNKDITFHLDVKEPNHRVNYTGGINKEYQDYIDYQNYLKIKDRTLAGLETFYTPDQDFYKAIKKEAQRIASMKPVVPKNETLKYYIDTKDLIDVYDEQKVANTAIKEEALKHLTRDSDELENYGFLPQFVQLYLTHSYQGAVSKQQAGKLIEKACDELLAAVGEDTPRGQSVLVSLITLLQASNFKDLGEKYTKEAQALTCEITPELKNMLQGAENIKVGKKAPNIVFDKKIKGSKSLYDIKANKKLIVFWGSWCGHCQHELPYIKEFYKNFKKSGGEIVAVAVDLDANDYMPLVNDVDWINYSDLLKWDGKAVKDFAVDGTPTLIMLDKNNKILKIGSRISQFTDYLK
ncbi:TlpA family protein disulfide reductase [Ornithobacterium rhinotracheale]|nr:TlpA family protein disulfide reductase [Ornithobacterium rhinotracheale]